MANKITTQSYFIKRLKDSGYVVYKIFDEYSEADPRNWTVMIDPGNASVLCSKVSVESSGCVYVDTDPSS